MLTGQIETLTPKSRIAAFLMANVGLPFCLPCIGHELGLGTSKVVGAAAVLVGGDRFKLTNRCCARCFSEQAVLYLGMK